MNWIKRLLEPLALFDDSVLKSPRSRFRTALVLAVAADALQVVVFPLFAEGAISPLDDILDLTVMATLASLIGWHWEFLPSFVAELVPGLDLVPFWTLAVANVYRKWKQTEGRRADDAVREIVVQPIERNLSDH
jgi:hypothetical protein